MKNILSLSHQEAREFFIKHCRYVRVKLPPYINFDPLLVEISKKMNGNSFEKFKKSNPKKIEHINYQLFDNKNGKYDWRPFKFVHPVLYVSLVNEITKEYHWNELLGRLKEIRCNSVVDCFSLPIVSENADLEEKDRVINWRHKVEQKSLENSLDYKYIGHTDIANCYSSIYVHSISWSIYGKKEAKKCYSDKKTDGVGFKIENHIQSMSYRETNGIPQGSVLMDFIAEIVLHYADLLLSEKIKDTKGIESFEILRYRDDYRIFSNSQQTIDTIIKTLSEVLIGLGLKLNPQKTICSDNVIQSSIKTDKINWWTQNSNHKTLQERLLILHKFSFDYPNSGTLSSELSSIFEWINHEDGEKILEEENIQILISIVVDISYHNPRLYSVSMAIVSSLLSVLDVGQSIEIVRKIIKKFDSLPNTGYMDIWLQRAAIKLDIKDDYFKEKLCKLVSGDEVKIWNNDWLNHDMKNAMEAVSIINNDKINKISFKISIDEFWSPEEQY